MKALFSFLFFINTVLFSFSQNITLIDSTISDRYYSSRIPKKILFRKENIVTSKMYWPTSADVSSFKVVAPFYGKDKNFIFYKAEKLNNGDIETFGWNKEAEIPFDKDYIYYPEPKKNLLVPIENADKETYERVKLSQECLLWYRDKNNYYYNHILTKADRKTLSFKSEYLPFDETYIFYIQHKTCKDYKYIGTVRVVGNKTVSGGEKPFLSTVCGGKDDNILEFEIENISTLEFKEKFKGVKKFAELIFKFDNTVYYKGNKLFVKELGNIDLKLLLQILNFYYQYKEKVYHITESICVEVVGADPNTFKHIRDLYYADKDNIYYDDKQLPNVDLETFEILEDNYSKDKNKAYYKAKEILDVDIKTFSVAKYDLRDKISILGKEIPLDNVRADFGIDKNYVYLNERIISKYPKTFKILNTNYAKDEAVVFFNFNEIKNADSKTFEVVENMYAKDKNYVYKSGKILEGFKPSEFIKDKCGRLPDSPVYNTDCPSSSGGWGGDDDD